TEPNLEDWKFLTGIIDILAKYSCITAGIYSRHHFAGNIWYSAIVCIGQYRWVCSRVIGQFGLQCQYLCFRLHFAAWDYRNTSSNNCYSCHLSNWRNPGNTEYPTYHWRSMAEVHSQLGEGDGRGSNSHVIDCC